MSKTIGNVIDPYDLAEKFGFEALRYFLLKEIPPFDDGDITGEKFAKTYQADLANGLGNLVQRVAKLCQLKNLVFVPKSPPAKQDPAPQDNLPNFSSHIERFEFNLALEELWQELSALDAKINLDKPWEKSDDKAGKDLKVYVEKILELSSPLSIFLPQTASKILKIFTGPKIVTPPRPLFPRLS